MSRSEQSTFFRVSRIALGPIGTFIFGLIFIGLGWSTYDTPPPNLPGRDGVALLCFTAATVAIGASVYFRERMSFAHEVMGLVLMLVAVTRGVLDVVAVTNDVNEGSPSIFSALSSYSAPWAWAVIFSSGMLLWAYGRRESVIRQIRDEDRRKG